MKKILITPNEVVELVFGVNSAVEGGVVLETEIETAQTKFIKPVLGALFSKLLESKYPELLDGYIKLPLALYVKSLAIRNRAIQTGAMGVVKNGSNNFIPASDTSIEIAVKNARSDARNLLKEAIRYIEGNIELYPEYNPEANILNTTSMASGVVIAGDNKTISRSTKLSKSEEKIP